MGKTISYYDGWSGSHDYFKIGYLKKDGSSIHVFPEKGKGWGVLIPLDILPQLIEKGKYTKSNEIERCPYEIRWELLNK